MQLYRKLYNQEALVRVVNFPEARKSLKAVIDQVVEDADYATISRRDSPEAVVMSLSTYYGRRDPFPSRAVTPSAVFWFEHSP